tara:strand:- start:825 stop:1451 length:627 start_codon:yes stop_codon:yes gene_type:complete
MIAIIDYGMGNLRSVQKGFEFVGADARVTSSQNEILDANAVVLPGVGAFRDCIKNLERFNLVDTVKRSAYSGKPFLGICLGLQLLFSQSEEFGEISGLDILPGRVKRFPKSKSGDKEFLKIPHMGWNRAHLCKNSPLFDSIQDSSYFYFVHSYYVVPKDPEVCVTKTHHGIDFVSGIQSENIHAFQFHPEKSQKDGLQILKSFSELGD